MSSYARDECAGGPLLSIRVALVPAFHLVRREGAVDAGIVQPPDMCRLPAFAIRRGAYPHVVRTSRYAAAVALQGRVLASDDLVLHLCDLPLCVRSVTAADVEAGVGAHIVLGSQSENMRRMAFMARGGGRRAIVTHGAGLTARLERSRALREAVREGWDDDAVQAALLGQPDQYRLW